MLSSVRNALRRTGNFQRMTAPTLGVRRAGFTTRVRVTERYKWAPVTVGALTLSAALMFGNAVRLDSVEGSKLKSKSNERMTKQVVENTKPEELLQANEDEAGEQSSSADTTTTSSEPSMSSEGESEGESGGGGGAFNPETGEINWDCPCLGGMAHGPCGQEFREAFSCFVFSEEEPKGINCVELFKNMQDCFRRHPEVYGEEIMSDDDDEENGKPPSGTDSPGIQGEALPDADPIATPTPGIVSPSP